MGDGGNEDGLTCYIFDGTTDLIIAYSTQQLKPYKNEDSFN